MFDTNQIILAILITKLSALYDLSIHDSTQRCFQALQSLKTVTKGGGLQLFDDQLLPLLPSIQETIPDLDQKRVDAFLAHTIEALSEIVKHYSAPEATDGGHRGPFSL